MSGCEDKARTGNHNLSSTVSRHQPHPNTPQKLLITLLFSLVTKRWGGRKKNVFPRVSEVHKGKPQNMEEWKKKKKRLSRIWFFFFQEESLTGQRNKQHHKHTSKHSRCLISSWVCVSDCFPCVAPGRGLSKSSFHKCQDQATAVTAWHPLRWFGDGEGRGGGLQNKEGKAEEVKIEDGEWREDGAFVHLKENEKGKRLSLEGNCPRLLQSVGGIRVCVCVCVCSWRRENGEEGNLWVRGGVVLYICWEN